MSKKTQLSTENTPKKHNRKKVIAIVLALVIIVTSATIGLGYTLSRYVGSSDKDYHYIDAADFYFSADYLTTYTTDSNIPTYNIYNYPKNKTVTINVYNYTDELSITKENVTFSTNTSKGTISSGGTISGGSKNYKAITLTANGTGEYLVTVSSTAPYNQTLKAKFNFVEAAAPTLNTSFNNYDDYVTLNVAVAPNAQTSCNVKVTWDANSLVLDTTNDLFASSTISSGTATVSMNTGGSYQIIFYKKTSGATIASTAVSASIVNG